MTSDDDIYERLIENFRPRLRELITVPPVLDVLQTIGSDQKERIRQKEVTDGNQAAADLLVDAVVRKPHEAGWFQAFVEALQASGCAYAADCIQVKLPEPEVEAENDFCVKLTHLLFPKLLGMKTEVVALHCFSQNLITQADKEIVSGPHVPQKWLCAWVHLDLTLMTALTWQFLKTGVRRKETRRGTFSYGIVYVYVDWLWFGPDSL